jgi:hypothetical protein
MRDVIRYEVTQNSRSILRIPCEDRNSMSDIKIQYDPNSRQEFDFENIKCCC